MSKGSNTTVKNVTDPWSGIQPYLKNAYSAADDIYKGGAPGYYPGNLIAPQSANTQTALQNLGQRGAAGSDITRAAQGQLQDTLSGTYLNGETPGFQGALNAATRPIIDNYTKTIMPGMDSNFSSAGRYGSGAHAMASGDAAGGLMDALGDTTSRMVYQNYGDERNRQIQGMLFAPEMAAQDYKDIAAQGEAGAAEDAYAQAQIDADLAKYNYDANKDYNWTSQYLGLLNGANGGSSTQTGPRPNPITGALGGGIAGLGLGSSLFGAGGALSSLVAPASLYASGGILSGLGAGGASGLMGGLGLLAGLSDRNMKTNIEYLWQDEQTGLPVYAFDYKADVGKGIAKRVGPMAQDVEEMFPGTTSTIAGIMIINYGKLAQAVEAKNALVG